MVPGQGHSPLGGSGAERFIACPGSAGLSYSLVDQESDHAALGTAAHALAEICLLQEADAWEFIGFRIIQREDGRSLYAPPDAKDAPEGGITVDKEMADAVQMYLDAVRQWHPDRNQGNFFVEKAFYCPTIHPLFWGKSDAVYLQAGEDHEEWVLHVWDYKHGAGIVVEVEDNPQCKYYAAGVLEELKAWEVVDKVVLHIAQPRGFHYDGPIRHWEISVSDLVAWLEDELIPAMDRAMVSRDTKTGEHCRFCPAASRACPAILKDMEELEMMVKELEGRTAAELSNAQVARFMELFEIAKIVKTKAEQSAFERLSAGHDVPGFKLAPKRANRVWKDAAAAAAQAEKEFGSLAFTEPGLKSPAQIEAMPKGKDFVAKYAHKPDTGLTVVPADDARPAVNKSNKSAFKPTKRGKAA